MTLAMKKTLTALFFGICAMAQGAEPALKSWDGNYLSTFELAKEMRVESFETLLASFVPSRLIAEDMALQYWVKNHGLLAEEGVGATGLFRIGRDIKDFATRGEWIWEIRVIHHGLSLDGVIWINAHTKKIRALGPNS
jgi:hypothetical protein